MNFKKDNIIPIFIILIIFSTGFLLRFESSNLPGINETEKSQYMDSNGLPYMYELDSYYNLRLTENFLKNGHLGDTIKYNQSWDSFSYFPPGRPAVYPPLIVWLAAFSFILVNLFVNMSLLDVSFWIPAVLGPLAGIVGYLFVRKYTGEYAGFVTGILVVSAPIYLMRTLPGFFDTDMFNIIIPFLTIFFFSEAMETSNKKNRILYTVLSSFSMLLFSLAWTGWPYLFYIILFTSIIYIILCKIRKIQIKTFLEIATSFFGISFFLIVLTSGINGILHVIYYPINFLPLLPGIESNVSWPNIYESVGELHKPVLEEFLSGVGPVNLGLGIFGIFVIASVMLRSKMRNKYLPKLSWFGFILIFTWITIALVAYSSSIRFGMLVIPPLAIFSGILMGIIVQYLKNYPISIFNKNLTTILSIILVLIICIPPIINVEQTTERMIPGVDDDIASAALWINSNTSNDTVIITDWGYGHFFTQYAKRPVLFDGGSQNTPRAYWVFRAFATDNETLSAGIMSMLSSSGDNSYLFLENQTKNTSLTVKIMNNILGVSKNQARHILIDDYKIKSNLTEKILNDTHPSNTHPFIIFTNDEMVYVGYWMFLFGDWNFNSSKKDNYTYSRGYTNNTTSLKKYSNGAVLDLENKKAFLNGTPPYSFSIVDKNNISTFYSNNKSDSYMIFVMDKNMVIIIDKKYQNSLFTKLILLKQPTEYFKPVYKNNSSILWESKIKN
ncbi:MAG: STT3 domain-containing protein [Methanobacteriaceae archaeon]|nr:STT3 domain-containing protein [Methanobacteriaceae archaeon]